ncbi:MAG TPA: DUF4062 domain-containing protein [Thermoanaerobaculia bacterium]|nr:DUF4062 domain-containing protein [Thermoanaerobaculia bacterium]
MELEIPQVFISSTSEFAEERARLAKELRSVPGELFEPFDYLEETARGTSPLEHCRAMIRKSQIVCLILGQSYGSAFPGETHSIVEWEFREAQRTPHVDLEGHIRNVPLQSIEPRQADFIRRATDFRDGTWCKKFDDSQQLIANAVAAARKCRAGIIREMLRVRKRLQRWKDSVVMSMQILTIVAGIGAFAWGFTRDVSSDRLMLLLAAIALTEVSLWPLLKYQIMGEPQHDNHGKS